MYRPALMKHESREDNNEFMSHDDHHPDDEDEESVILSKDNGSQVTGANNSDQFNENSEEPKESSTIIRLSLVDRNAPIAK